jgi:hypothetical protein
MDCQAAAQAGLAVPPAGLLVPTSAGRNFEMISNKVIYLEPRYGIEP